MKKVLIITYYWPPSGGAGVQRWVKFVKYLYKLNVEPIVLTVHPEYATYPQTDSTIEKDTSPEIKIFRTKSFELYGLYKKISSNKEVPYGGFANTKKVDTKEKIIRFIRGNFFIPDPRAGWNRYAIAEAKKIIRNYHIDTVITTSPPHSTQLIGLKLKKQLNIHWVADLRDPWTDIFYFKELYPTWPVMQIHKWLERKILKRADKIITVSESLKNLFSEKTDHIKNKIEVIPNGFDTDDFSQVPKISDPDHFYISYIGTLSKEYNLDGFIRALALLPESIFSRLKIRFAGKTAPEIQEQFIRAGLSDHMEIHGYVSHTKAVELMASSNLLLLVIPEVKNNNGILTGKLFEYMATRNPILLIGPEEGDAAQIIKETNSGNIFGYDEPENIAQTIVDYYHQKERSSSSKAPDSVLTYSRENLTRKLLSVIQSL